jgi:hypothetical protein
MAETGTSITTPALVKVTTAATAVQLVQTSTGTSGTTPKTVFVQALSTNEEAVVVGDKNVVAKAGTHGTPEQRGIELKPTQSLSLDLIDVTQIWVDSRKNGDGVAVLVLNA